LRYKVERSYFQTSNKSALSVYVYVYAALGPTPGKAGAQDYLQQE
jgi:hypothetical protein